MEQVSKYTSTSPLIPQEVDTENFTLFRLYNIYRKSQSTFLGLLNYKNPYVALRSFHII